MKHLKKILVIASVVLGASWLQANPTYSILQNSLPATAAAVKKGDGMNKCDEQGMSLIAVQNHSKKTQAAIWLKLYAGKDDKLTQEEYSVIGQKSFKRGNIPVLYKGKPVVICFPSKYRMFKWSHDKHGELKSQVNSFFGKLLRVRPYQFVRFTDGDFIHIYPDAPTADKKVIISSQVRGKSGAEIKKHKDNFLDPRLYPVFIKIK